MSVGVWRVRCEVDFAVDEEGVPRFAPPLLLPQQLNSPGWFQVFSRLGSVKCQLKKGMDIKLSVERKTDYCCKDWV